MEFWRRTGAGIALIAARPRRKPRRSRLKRHLTTGSPPAGTDDLSTWCSRDVARLALSAYRGPPARRGPARLRRVTPEGASFATTRARGRTLTRTVPSWPLDGYGPKSRSSTMLTSEASALPFRWPLDSHSGGARPEQEPEGVEHRSDRAPRATPVHGTGHISRRLEAEPRDRGPRGSVVAPARARGTARGLPSGRRPGARRVDRDAPRP
jgi:hypothetical protein